MQPIIFGTGPRRERVDEGEFFCPHCQTTRHYERLNVRNYFRLYFIPLIPLGDGREVVVCTTCNNGFDPQVLLMEKPKPKRELRSLAVQLNTLENRLRSGTPIEYAIADLTAAGLDRDLAQDNVDRVIGTARKSCPQCGLTYTADVMTCAEDGATLV